MAAWTGTLQNLKIKVVHESSRLRPARLQTRQPCHYLDQHEMASGTLKGEKAHQLLDLLAPARGDSAQAALASDCAMDSSRWDDLKLEFRGGDEPYYTADVSMDQGCCVFRSPKGPTRVVWLRSHAAPVLDLIRETLSDDKGLQSMAICDRTKPDSTKQSVGFVYVEKLPELVQAEFPEYPAELRGLGRQGMVIVQALIGTRGEVRETRISQSVDGLDESAVRCAEDWRFRPAVMGGQPIPAWVTIPIYVAPSPLAR
jgi:TonB family protein